MSKKILKDNVTLDELTESERIKAINDLAESYNPEPKEKHMFKNRTDKAHLLVSFIKSALRIAAGYFFIQMNLPMGGYLLIAAELLGVVEELVV